MNVIKINLHLTEDQFKPPKGATHYHVFQSGKTTQGNLVVKISWVRVRYGEFRGQSIIDQMYLWEQESKSWEQIFDLNLQVFTPLQAELYARHQNKVNKV